MKLGRLEPLYPPRLHLRSYFALREPLPQAPDAVDDSVNAGVVLSNVLGNDTHGDCTCAAAFHIAAMVLENAGGVVSDDYSVTKALAFYYNLTGGPDNGLDEITVLDAWKKQGLFTGSSPILGYVGVSGSNIAELEFAQWAFGNLYFALAMPKAWGIPSASGFTWDISGDADPDLGHAFCGVGYLDYQGVKIEPWGGLSGNLTWRAIKKYCDGRNGQVYTVLTPDTINRATSLAPSGFNLAQLTQDLDTL